MANHERPKRLVGTSTKMYFSYAQTIDYARHLLENIGNLPGILDTVDVFMIPDFLSAAPVAAMVKESGLLVGAQDTYHEDRGAFTGEVSPAVLSEIGCKFVELGHAERRRLFGETDESVAKKAAAVVRNGMTPLVCIGESSQGDVTTAVAECKAQVQSLLNAVPGSAYLVLAYEPVWAIGKAEPASADHVVAVTKEIRAMASNRDGTVRVIYGGSAGPGLFEKLKDGVDGLFLGRFAHDPERFAQTIREVSNG